MNKIFQIGLLVITIALSGCQSTTYKPEGLTEANSA